MVVRFPTKFRRVAVRWIWYKIGHSTNSVTANLRKILVQSSWLRDMVKSWVFFTMKIHEINGGFLQGFRLVPKVFWWECGLQEPTRWVGNPTHTIYLPLVSYPIPWISRMPWTFIYIYIYSSTYLCILYIYDYIMHTIYIYIYIYIYNDYMYIYI